jgi:hypothetical protein
VDGNGKRGAGDRIHRWGLPGWLASLSCMYDYMMMPKRHPKRQNAPAPEERQLHVRPISALPFIERIDRVEPPAVCDACAGGGGGGGGGWMDAQE